jgi:hypothetical protein
MSEEEKDADIIPIASAKKEEPEEPQTTTTKAAGMTDEQRTKWWEQVFWKLTHFPRFMTWINENYIFGINKDDEKKTVEPVVIEKENVPVALSGDQIFKIGVACMQHGANDATKLTKRILAILGHRDNAILPGTDAEIKQLTNQTDLKGKLEP